MEIYYYVSKLQTKNIEYGRVTFNTITKRAQQVITNF